LKSYIQDNGILIEEDEGEAALSDTEKTEVERKKVPTSEEKSGTDLEEKPKKKKKRKKK
jgi:hypothetical protein